MPEQQLQLLIGFLVPFVLQLLKRSQSSILSWVNQNTPKVSFALSAITAFFVAIGVGLHYSPGSLTLTWPSIDAMAHGLTTFLVQLAAQHIGYEAFWRHVLPASTTAKDALASVSKEGARESTFEQRSSLP